MIRSLQSGALRPIADDAPKRARPQLQYFLLRHGWLYIGKKQWRGFDTAPG
jgi:hypothetical protein